MRKLASKARSFAVSVLTWPFTKKDSCEAASECQTMLLHSGSRTKEVLDLLNQILKGVQKMSQQTDAVAQKLTALDAKVTALVASVADIKNQLASASTAAEVDALGAQVDAIAAKIPA